MRLLPRHDPDEPPTGQLSRTIIEQHVGEGVLVARSALRLTVKNGVIIATLRDARPWSTDYVVALARQAVDNLITELSSTAERLEVAAAGQATHGRSAQRRRARLEATRLEMRALTARGVVEWLQEMHNDEIALEHLVQSARDDTLTELMQARLQPGRTEVQQTEEECRIAMEGVVADLLELQAQRDALQKLGDSGW